MLETYLSCASRFIWLQKIQPNTLITYHPTTPSPAKQQPARALFQPSPSTENQQSAEAAFQPSPSAENQSLSAENQMPNAANHPPSASYPLPRLIGAPWRQVSVPAAVIDQVYAEGNFGKRVKGLLVAVFTIEEIVNNNTIGSEDLGKLDQNKLCAIREHLTTLQPDENPRQALFTIKVHCIINARCRRIRYGKGEKKSVSAFLTCTGNSVPPNPNSDPLHQNPNSEPPLNDDLEHLDGDHQPLNTSILAVRTSPTIRKRLDTQTWQGPERNTPSETDTQSTRDTRKSL
ncbi:Hypp8200 [Branchiostoma lanceolatum]|uniref:Hypp8200 protein n=1 Tax=Branchiostoma lanceolatum TaxID=7740 RepID=A0A8J9Z736_BRALA|nr:Hypp8200 [Branchiostoma lanceolatum]